MTTLRREIIERSQEAKKRQRKINLILFLVIVVLTLVLFVQIFNHPKISINRVQIINPSSKLDNKEILTLIGEELKGRYGYFLNKRNYYFYPNEKLRSTILTVFPKIKNLDLKRDNNTLKVSIVVREPKYMWCHGAEDFCQYLDDEGIAISLAPKFSGETLLVFSPISTSTQVTKLGTSPFQIEDFNKLTNLISELEDNLKDSPFQVYNIREVLVLEDGDYKVRLVEPKQKFSPLHINISLKNSNQTTLTYLKSVLKSPEFKASLNVNLKPLKTLDLRFNQKVFYEFWE